MPTDSRNNNNNNTLIGLTLGFAVLLLAWFIADLLDSKAGERVGALGAVVGGIIGAGGAVFAVYLAITGQRKEDMAKVRAAVRTEVTTYSKYLIGTLEVCKQIATQAAKIPTVDAEYIGKNLVDPVIYPAVADRAGLLRRPQATIEFYMRIAETKSNLSAIYRKDARLTQGQADMTHVQPSHAEIVADSLITALQLARHIVADDDPTRTEMDISIQKAMLADIDEALVSAKVVFPNAESFEIPTTA
jgi:hypothetical protein